MCLAAHDWKFPQWTPLYVKHLLPPRQSRGGSLGRLANILACQITKRLHQPGPLLIGWVGIASARLDLEVMLVVHTVIAISLVVLVIISVHDSLSLRATLSEEGTSQTSCEQPGFRS